jgi:hypothetical protein
MKDVANKTAVYWGVEPYPKGHEGFAPYVDWGQSQARDLGEADFNRILKSANDWLKASVLSDATGEMVSDAKFRAALDLAIRVTDNGKYSVGLHPTTYNKLLARLAGVSSNETLVTIREATESVYHPTRERTTTMRPSAQIRHLATKYASTNSEVAFDLLDLSSKVAQSEEEQEQQTQKQGGELPPALKKHMEEKEEGKKDEGQDQGQKQAYAQLKAACIQAATTNPAARSAFLPVLKVIKHHG